MKFAGMGIAEVRRLKQLEEEHRKPKQLVADLSLDQQILQDAHITIDSTRQPTTTLRTYPALRDPHLKRRKPQVALRPPDLRPSPSPLRPA